MKLALITLAVFTLAIAALHAQLIAPAITSPTTAELAAQSVIDAVNAEIIQRVKVHQICWQTIWQNQRPGATPAAVLSALGTKAALVFAFANENLEHIGRCAQMVGKTRADFISDADCIPPLPFTVQSDGRVTLN